MKVFGFLLLSFLWSYSSPPDWLKKKPENQSSYIGIAKISKIGDDFKERAINTALSFISSEISVTVKSTTSNLIKDVNGLVSDIFESTSITTSKEELEGYEIVDTWESRKEYAVYCKLSKQKYLDSKRKKFLGSIEIMRNTYETYEAAIKNRNFSLALDFAYSLKKDSDAILRNGNILPFMTSFEIRDVAMFRGISEQMLAGTKVLVKNEGVYPFSWCGPEQVKIALIDQEGRTWNNWQGTLYDSEDNLIHCFEKQSDEFINFPKTFYIGSLNSLRFMLAIPLKYVKGSNFHKINFHIPVEVPARIGEIILDGIPETLKKDIVDFAEKFFVGLNQSQNLSSIEPNVIDIKIEYFRSFSSAKWEKGVLVITFKNISAAKFRNVGAGKLEVSGSGNTLEQAINNAIKTLNSNFSKSDLKKWK